MIRVSLSCIYRLLYLIHSIHHVLYAEVADDHAENKETENHDDNKDTKGSSDKGYFQPKILYKIIICLIIDIGNFVFDFVSSDTGLAKIVAEKRLALIKAWEDSEKTKAENR